jgi:hypothetical protein
MADGTYGLSVLILAALVAQFEVKGEHELFVGIQIDSFPYVFLVEELLGSTFETFEAVRAFPVAVRHLDKPWLQAPIVVNLVTNGADEESFPVLGRVTLLAEDTIVAPPVVLELLATVLGIGQAIGVETLTAQVAAQKVFLVAKSATKVAHLLEDKIWIVKGDLDRVGVPTHIPLIIHPQILHQPIPLLPWGYALALGLELHVQLIAQLQGSLVLAIHVDGIRLRVLRCQVEQVLGSTDDCLSLDSKEANVGLFKGKQERAGLEVVKVGLRYACQWVFTFLFAQVELFPVLREEAFVDCALAMCINGFNQFLVVKNLTCFVMNLDCCLEDISLICIVSLGVYKYLLNVTFEGFRV